MSRSPKNSTHETSLILGRILGAQEFETQLILREQEFISQRENIHRFNFIPHKIKLSIPYYEVARNGSE